MKSPKPNKLQQVAVQVLLHGPLSEVLKADPQHRMALNRHTWIAYLKNQQYVESIL